jgi:hypothetical protein
MATIKDKDSIISVDFVGACQLRGSFMDAFFKAPHGKRLLLVSSLAIFGVTPVLSKPLPTGFFELRPTTDTIEDVTKTAGWLRPDVAGIAIRVHWNVIQPTSSTIYDWSYIDAVKDLAIQHGKQFSILVEGGVSAPAWVYLAGPDGNGSSQFTVTGKGVMPAPWDSNFQRRWSTFLIAMGTKYDLIPNLSYVIVTGQGYGGQATFCKSQADDAELAAAGGLNVWVNAFVSIVGLYVNAFPQTPLIVNIGAPLYPNLLGGFKTATALCLTSYGTHFGIKNNGLSPASSTTGWQAAEISALSPTNPVGFQMLAASATATDLANSIEIGETIGSNLFEVYSSDLKLVSDLTTL